MEDFLYEFARVRKVIKSCTTNKQMENATIWAKDWSKRMASLYPDMIPSWEDLYQQVISE